MENCTDILIYMWKINWITANCNIFDDQHLEFNAEKKKKRKEWN